MCLKASFCPPSSPSSPPPRYRAFLDSEIEDLVFQSPGTSKSGLQPLSFNKMSSNLANPMLSTVLLAETQFTEPSGSPVDICNMNIPFITKRGAWCPTHKTWVQYEQVEGYFRPTRKSSLLQFGGRIVRGAARALSRKGSKNSQKLITSNTSPSMEASPLTSPVEMHGSCIFDNPPPPPKYPSYAAGDRYSANPPASNFSPPQLPGHDCQILHHQPHAPSELPNDIIAAAEMDASTEICQDSHMPQMREIEGSVNATRPQYAGSLMESAINFDSPSTSRSSSGHQSDNTIFSTQGSMDTVLTDYTTPNTHSSPIRYDVPRKSPTEFEFQNPTSVDRMFPLIDGDEVPFLPSPTMDPQLDGQLDMLDGEFMLDTPISPWEPSSRTSRLPKTTLRPNLRTFTFDEIAPEDLQPETDSHATMYPSGTALRDSNGGDLQQSRSDNVYYSAVRTISHQMAESVPQTLLSDYHDQPPNHHQSWVDFLNSPYDQVAAAAGFDPGTLSLHNAPPAAVPASIHPSFFTHTQMGVDRVALVSQAAPTGPKPQTPPIVVKRKPA
jgi:hypothetical protein